MKSKLSLIIAIIALCITLVTLILSVSGVFSKPENTEKQEEKTEAAKETEEDVQYVLYLGTNDKDTNEPVYEPEEAKNILKDILISYMGGYTIQEANGGWIGDDGTEYQEYTLVIYLSDTTLEDVHALCDELITKYDQSSVLIQMNKTQTEFYSTPAE